MGFIGGCLASTPSLEDEFITEVTFDGQDVLFTRNVELPENPKIGDAITGLPKGNAKDSEETYVFHAGTALDGATVLTNGGRVLCVTTLGETVKFAQSRVYQLIQEIQFEGAQYRQDIGYRAVKG